MTKSMIVVLLLVVGCSRDDDDARPASETAIAEAPRVVDQAEVETPALAPEVEATEVEVPATPEPTAPNIFSGKLVMMFERIQTADSDDEVEGPYIVISRIGDQPKPSGAPTGYVYVHSGHWEVRLIREIPTEFSRARVLSRAGGCEAQVVRALEIHTFHPPIFNDSGSSGEQTFRALELRGCPRGGIFAIAGVEDVHVYSLRRNDMSTPASPELVALVRESDNEAGWLPPLDADAFRVRRFPELGFSVVAGLSAWVVRDGVVLNERFGGTAEDLFHAGPLVLFAMSSTNEGWVASIDDFNPPPVTCVVHDSSGTELNIRAAPRRGAAVVQRIANGEEVRVYETRGAWRRLSPHRQRAGQWVHASGVRCLE